MTGQTDFTAALLDPALDVPQGLTDPEGRPAGKRFDVYRNNVIVSLMNAAEEAFPVLQKLLGEQNFRVLAGAYVRAHPPSSPLMMFFGQDMPAFLERFEPVQRWPYMPDIARLELALRRAYHAADATALPPDALAIDPARLMGATFTLAPAVQVIRSNFPIHGIWAMNMDLGGKPEPRAEDVLVTRPEMDPEPRLMPPGAAAFIEALRHGVSFGAAHEAATQEADEFDLSATLGLLLQTNALTGMNERDAP